MALINDFMSKYPYTDFQTLNLDWIIAQMLQLRSDMKDFVTLNTIKYADPIQWNITTQYQGNTVVVEPISGDAYLSTQPVPAGVAITDTEYWTVIGSFGSIFTDIKASIAAADEGPSTVATGNRATGDLVWLGDKLYVCTQDIATGESYVEGSNCELVTVEMLLKKEARDRADADAIISSSILAIGGQITNINGSIATLAGDITDEENARINADNVIHGSILTLAGQIAELEVSGVKYTPEMYGAKGDGITDDTTAFQTAINNALINGGLVLATQKYKITSPLVVDVPSIISGDQAKANIIFNKIIYTGNTHAFVITGFHVRIHGGVLVSNADGISLGNGTKGCQLVYIDILEIDANKSAYITNPSSTENVQYVYINNGNIYYGDHGLDIDLTNRYIGEIHLTNIAFSGKSAELPGSAIYIHNWSGHNVAGLYLNNVSFEGSQNYDCIELDNISMTRPIIPLVMYGIRYSEPRVRGNKLITATTAADTSPIIDALINVDEIQADSIHIPSSRGNLEINGIFVETGCTHSVYSAPLDKVVPYPVIYEAKQYSGTATHLLYTKVVRLTGNSTFPLDMAFIGTQIIYSSSAVTVTFQTGGGDVTRNLTANSAVIVQTMHIDNVGVRALISQPIDFTMHTPS